ncbi:hypothetical protein DL96DRAFT_491209 [Flagelloscypha sp. PMI_526]|nr:hypothetical protein DL96DRAFT_491209 [Flagelloscypha sp. PMI_526]
MESISEPKDVKAITALAFDGSSNSLDSLSELYILQEVASRWAFDTRKDIGGDEVHPSEMFDIIAGTGIGGFYAILFARLNLTAWSLKDQTVCMNILDVALDEIMRDSEICLDSSFKESKPKTRAIICVVNSTSSGSCRFLRNYRSRGSPSPPCSIRQVIRATLSNGDQIPPAKIQEEYFSSALNGFANPTYVLMKELGNALPRGTMIACVVNIGAGQPTTHSLTCSMDSASAKNLALSSTN